MRIASTLKRRTVSDDVAAAVRALIAGGGLPEGERVNEVHLAARLA